MSIFHDTLVSKMCCTRFSCIQKGLVNGDWEGLRSQYSAGLVVPCFLAQFWCPFTCPGKQQGLQEAVLLLLWGTFDGLDFFCELPFLKGSKQSLLLMCGRSSSTRCTSQSCTQQSTLLILPQVNMSFIFFFLFSAFLVFLNSCFRSLSVKH